MVAHFIFEVFFFSKGTKETVPMIFQLYLIRYMCIYRPFLLYHMYVQAVNTKKEKEEKETSRQGRNFRTSTDTKQALPKGKIKVV